MTLEQIESLTVENCFQEILPKVIILPEGTIAFLNPELGEDWYLQIVMPEGVPLPEKSVFENAFIEYKQELINQFKPIWDEENRQNLLRTKFDSLYSKDAGMPSFHKIWPNVVNPLAFFNENLSNKDFDFKFDAVLLEENKLVSAELVQKAYDRMNSEVYAKMQETFGTSNAESAAANQSTWMLMVQSPTSFIGVIGFTSVEEVLAYSQPKYDSAIAYGIWRLNRIQQFRDEKNQILEA